MTAPVLGDLLDWVAGRPTRRPRHQDELSQIMDTAADALATAAHVMLANGLSNGVRGELNRGRVMWEQGLAVGRSMRPFVDAGEELHALRFGYPDAASVRAAVRKLDPDRPDRRELLTAETMRRVYEYLPGREQER